MKIGILTFDYCNNFGAVLQAYALRKYLVTLGHDVSFGAYQLPQLLHRYDLIPNFIKERSLKRRIKYYILSIKKYKRWKRKRELFKSFRKDFLPVTTLQDKDVKLWIVGSDQVWNPKITKCYDEIYYANGELKQPHIFYAVSCPSALLKEDVLVDIKNKKYPVGVREANMIETLKKFGITNELVLDPTLLLPYEGWESLIKPREIEKKYIFSYNLSGTKQLPVIAKQLEKQYGWINLPSFSLLKESGPIDFINYFKYAEVTLVSSFHGVAFSVIFHRPFFFFPNNDERDERAFSLLKSLHLEQCIFRDTYNNVIPDINWNVVDDKLKDLRKISEEFLKKNIKRYDIH